MTITENAKTEINPWLAGSALSAIAMIAGFVLGWTALTVTTNNFAREPAIIDRVIEGAIRGLIFGVLQWPIVKPAGVRPASFLLASASGLAMGYPLGQYLAEPWGLGLSWVAAFAAYGTLLGLAQWSVMRGRVGMAWLWVPLSAIGWILTMLVWGAVMQTPLGFFTGLLLGAIPYGLVSGLGLVWLAQYRRLDPGNRD